MRFATSAELPAEEMRMLRRLKKRSICDAQPQGARETPRCAGRARTRIAPGDFLDSERSSNAGGLLAGDDGGGATLDDGEEKIGAEVPNHPQHRQLRNQSGAARKHRAGNGPVMPVHTALVTCGRCRRI